MSNKLLWAEISAFFCEPIYLTVPHLAFKKDTVDPEWSFRFAESGRSPLLNGPLYLISQGGEIWVIAIPSKFTQAIDPIAPDLCRFRRAGCEGAWPLNLAYPALKSARKRLCVHRFDSIGPASTNGPP